MASLAAAGIHIENGSPIRVAYEWADIAEPGSVLARAAANPVEVVHDPDFAPDNSLVICRSPSSDPIDALARFRAAVELMLADGTHHVDKRESGHTYRYTSGYREQLGRDLTDSDKLHLIVLKGRERPVFTRDDWGTCDWFGEFALGIR